MNNSLTANINLSEYSEIIVNVHQPSVTEDDSKTLDFEEQKFELTEKQDAKDSESNIMFTWTGWNKRLLIIYLYWN